MVISHPIIRPIWPPSNFSLFGYLKMQLDSYSDSNSLQQAVTKAIRAIPQDEYRKTFNKWIERIQLCIANKGEYFEHLMK